MKIEVEIERLLPGFIASARWWPWKTASPEIKIENKIISPPLIAYIIESHGKRFHLPLVVSDNRPKYLPAGRIMNVNGKYVYEAEFSPKYIELIGSISDYKKQEFTKLKGRPVESKPLSLESTNVLSRVQLETGEEIVVKGYRLIEKVNVETKIMRRLAKAGYKHIPPLHHIYSIGKYDVTIITGFVHGAGDGGAPFYQACLEYLTSSSSLKGMRLGLAGKLGTIIAGLHKALNTASKDRFFGVEDIGGDDVEEWVRRLEIRHKAVSEILDRLAGEDERYDYWRKLYEEKAWRIIEISSEGMRLFIGRKKARTHQDLHLAQMIYVPDKQDFIITDFEGEPGRTLEEKLVKEPLLRDIASMIRSFQYLSFAAYMNARRLSIDEAARRLMEKDPTRDWRMKHITSMTASYIAGTAGAGLHGLSEAELIGNIWAYLYPWVVERALYETYYEANYRPEWIPIPLIGMLNPTIPHKT